MKQGDKGFLLIAVITRNYINVILMLGGRVIEDFRRIEVRRRLLLQPQQSQGNSICFSLCVCRCGSLAAATYSFVKIHLQH